jgi:putative addiction module component (TIGR02574 family)
MTDQMKPFDYSHLSTAERILLAEDLLDSVAAKQDAAPLTPAQEEELRRRLAAADRGETTYSSWPEVKHRLLHPK